MCPVFNWTLCIPMGIMIYSVQMQQVTNRERHAEQHGAAWCHTFWWCSDTAVHRLKSHCWSPNSGLQTPWCSKTLVVWTRPKQEFFYRCHFYYRFFTAFYFVALGTLILESEEMKALSLILLVSLLSCFACLYHRDPEFRRFRAYTTELIVHILLSLLFSLSLRMTSVVQISKAKN
jgi:hypothetical protein